MYRTLAASFALFALNACSGSQEPQEDHETGTFSQEDKAYTSLEDELRDLKEQEPCKQITRELPAQDLDAPVRKPYEPYIPLDTRHEEIRAEFDGIFLNNTHTAPTYSDFLENDGELEIRCENVHYSLSGNIAEYDLQISEYPFGLFRETTEIIRTSTYFGVDGAAHNLGHEIEHASQQRRGLFNLEPVKKYKLQNLETSIQELLFLEATAEVSAIDGTYQQFLEGNTDQLLAVLNFSTLNPSPHLFNYSERVAKAYISTLYGFDAYPEDLSMDRLSDMTPLSDPNIRQKAQAAAFEEYLRFDARKAFPEELLSEEILEREDAHIYNYMIDAIDGYHQELGKIGTTTANPYGFGLSISVADLRPASDESIFRHVEFRNDKTPTIVRADSLELSDYTIIDGIDYSGYISDEYKNPDFLKQYYHPEIAKLVEQNEQGLNAYVEKGTPPAAAYWPEKKVLTREEFLEYKQASRQIGEFFTPEEYFLAKENGDLELFLESSGNENDQTRDPLFDTPHEQEDWEPELGIPL